MNLSTAIQIEYLWIPLKSSYSYLFSKIFHLILYPRFQILKAKIIFLHSQMFLNDINDEIPTYTSF